MLCLHFSDTLGHDDRLIDVTLDFFELMIQYAKQNQN